MECLVNPNMGALYFSIIYAGFGFLILSLYSMAILVFKLKLAEPDIDKEKFYQLKKKIVWIIFSFAGGLWVIYSIVMIIIFCIQFCK